MAAAAAKPIPVELELGGKDAMIICADANLKRAAKAAAWGGLVNCGQMCVSVERILVVDEVHDEFVRLLESEVRSITQGGPEENADIGPMIFGQQVALVDRHVQDARQRGAQILSGGRIPEGPGQYYPPTLLTDVTEEMEIYREETFGPVLPVVRCRDEAHAVELANNHQYGLNGSVWTRDIRRGMKLASQVEAGQVSVNDLVASVGNPAIPFGGVKNSGFGRYHGPEGLLSFSHTRSLMVDRGFLPTEPFWFPYGEKYPHMARALQRTASQQHAQSVGRPCAPATNQPACSKGLTMHRPVFIGVAGGTGSGKTTVAMALRNALPADRCVIIDHDAYYRDLAHLTFEDRQNINFDDPRSLENELLVRHLETLRNGEAIEKAGVQLRGAPAR